MLWQLGEKVLDVLRSGELTSELRIYIWPFYLVMLVGALVATIVVAARFIGTLLEGPGGPLSSNTDHPEEAVL
jgi:hypothetical protein